MNLYQNKFELPLKLTRENSKLSRILSLEAGLLLMDEVQVEDMGDHLKTVISTKLSEEENEHHLWTKLNRYRSFLYSIGNRRKIKIADKSFEDTLSTVVDLSYSHISSLALFENGDDCFLIFLRRELPLLLFEPLAFGNEKKKANEKDETICPMRFTTFDYAEDLCQYLIERSECLQNGNEKKKGNGKGNGNDLEIKIEKEKGNQEKKEKNKKKEENGLYVSILIRQDRLNDESLVGKMQGGWEVIPFDPQTIREELDLSNELERLNTEKDDLDSNVSLAIEQNEELKKQNSEFEKCIIKFENEIERLEPIYGKFTCCICYMEKSNQDIVLTECCEHKTCMDCMKGYAEHQIKSSQIPIKCPGYKCEIDLNGEQLLGCLPIQPNLFDKFKEFSLKVYLAKNNNNTVLCPNLKCQKETLVEGDILYFSCNYCGRVSCLKCETEYHWGMTCEEYQEKLEQEKIERVQLDEKNQQNNQASEDWITQNTKKCVGCNAVIVKNKGCNHMTCTQCKSHFCFECGEIISNNDTKTNVNQRVHDHYKTGKCVYFTEDMVKN
ncbi:rbr-type e3 ubiquitin transferase [Anaeramoeba flamelloides]|uniref:RBR-type E3 ubiquitin transferase n=1 Tax=Anaeramoeba flamelloides TaxID=1746091 RepID=A0ABQ8YWD7_9EUKA|nr:rbr-type e3 ubiquitin transferase [Anaeramoeba flamelloides]